MMYHLSCIFLLFLTFLIILNIFLFLKLYSVNVLNKSIFVNSKNRFFKKTSKRLSDAKPNEYMMISIDIDNLKTISTLYGYNTSIKIINLLTKLIKENRHKDTLFYKSNSNIFLILCKTHYSISTKNKTCSKLIVLTECINKLVADKLSISFSQGIYIISNPAESLEHIIEYANEARLSGKQIYGTTTLFYTQKQKQKRDNEHEIISTMETAIKNNEFYIVIQPKYNLESKKIVGGEALVRWKKHDGFIINPDQFIPIFEENGFITKLDYYVLECVCRFLQANTNCPRISINISPNTAMLPNIANKYLCLLQKYGITTNQVELELTETSLDCITGQLQDSLLEFKNFGFKISIDDFGKSGSSLFRIRTLDIDAIKLDKEFIVDNWSSKKGLLILKSIIVMASTLQLTILAEGIETVEQLNILSRLGCDEGQGYFFSKPLELNEFLSTLRDNEHIKHNIDTMPIGTLINYVSDYENLPYGIMICKNDPYSTIIRANDAAYKILGYTKQEMLKIHQNRFVYLILDNLYDEVQKKLMVSSVIDMEFRIRKKNGELIWIHDIAKYDKINDVFFITFMNNTLSTPNTFEHMSLSTYRAHKAMLYYGFDDLNDVIYMIDPHNFNIIYMNKKAIEIYGNLDESTWKQLKCHQLIHGTNSPCRFCANKDLHTDTYYELEYYSITLNKRFSSRNRLVSVDGNLIKLSIAKEIL